MKINKAVLICSLICLLLFLCAFTRPPVSPVLLTSDNEVVQLSYLNAEVDSSILSLVVNCDTDADYFEIANDIVVATDESFNNKLEKLEVRTENNKLIYKFSLSEPIKKIYIAPPTLYLPSKIKAVTMPLVTDNNIKDKDIEWFSIASVTTEIIDDDWFAVIVTINPNNDVLPRFPHLIIDGKAIGGLASLNFNSNNVFNSGEFIYYFPSKDFTEIISKLSNASLSIEDTLVKVSSSNTLGISNIQSLEVN